MIPALRKNLRKLRVLLLVLPLLGLILSISPVRPLASTGVPAHPPRTAMFCLIGSICVDISVDL